MFFLSPIVSDLLGGFLSSMKGSSVTFVGGVVHYFFHALMGGSLSMNGRLLPQSFVGDGVIGNAFKLGCFLAIGDERPSDVVLGWDELMIIKVML